MSWCNKVVLTTMGLAGCMAVFTASDKPFRIVVATIAILGYLCAAVEMWMMPNREALHADTKKT